MDVFRYTGNRIEDRRNFMTLCAQLVMDYYNTDKERAEVFTDILTALAFLSRLMPSLNIEDPHEFIQLLRKPMGDWLTDAPDVVLIRDGRATKDCKSLASGFGLEPR